MIISHRTKLAALLSTTFLMSAPVFAQAEEPENEARLDTVTVTAQKRAQAITDLGLAVTAFTGDDLVRTGIAQPAELAGFTPGLSTGTAQSDGNPVFAIRGIGLDDFNPNNSSGVSIYTDQVYASSPAMLSFQMFDLERVEVLKGPQGTLYGRNATGGAINFISKKPTDGFDAVISADYGRWNRLELNGAVGGALSEGVRGRLSGTFLNQDDGWQTDVVTGEGVGKPQRWAARGQIEFDLSDALTGLINVHGGQDTSQLSTWQADDPFGLSALLIDTGISGIASPGEADLVDLGQGFTGIGGPRLSERDDQAWGTSLTLDWDLSFASLTSITAYESYDQYSADNYDGSPASLNDTIWDSDITQFSQELRLTSAATDPVSWVAGATYSNEKIDNVTIALVTDALDIILPLPVEFGGAGLPIEFTPGFNGVEATGTAVYAQETDAYGFFGQAEWQVSDLWKLIGGLRYSYEERSFDGTSSDDQGFLTGVVGPVAALTSTEDEQNVSGRVGIEMTPNDDILLYANVSTGFKSGVFFGTVVPESTAFGYVQPEKVLAYEGGVKATMLDGSLQLNAGGFLYKYDDKQTLVTVITSVGPAVSLGTVPEAEIMGAEVELFWRPMTGLDINLGLAYLDAEVTEGITAVRGLTLLSPVLEGTTLSFSPELSYNALVRYIRPINEGLDAGFQVDYRWQDEINSLLGDPQSDVDSYGSLGLQFMLESSSGSWEAALYGRNLLDGDQSTYSYTNFVGNRSFQLQLPRTYGIRLTRKFS